MAARREPPFGSFVPEQSTGLPVWGRIDGLAERDDKIGQRQFRPFGRYGKLEPIRDGVFVVRKPFGGDAGRSQYRTAERGARDRGTVATLPGCATEPVSGAAILGSGATVLGSSTTLLRT